MIIKSQPSGYIVNSNAIGDTVAALPVLKNIIDVYHKDDDYKVISLPEFRDLFFFVDDEHFHDINKEINFNKSYNLLKLNILDQDRTGYLMLPGQRPQSFDLKCQYLDPLKIHLSQYAGLQFSGRIYSIEDCSYLKYPINKELEKEILEKFKFNFSKCVLINTTYRDSNRVIEPEVLNELCRYIKNKNLVPMFVGKTETPEFVNEKHYKISECDYTLGIDLRDKTTILEMIYILNNSHSIIGVDNGLIHLAAMTDIPIVSAYTVIAPEVRAPIRYKKIGGGIEIIDADEDCRYCENTWNLGGYDFANCYYATNKCCKSLTIDKFISAFDKLLDRKI